MPPILPTLAPRRSDTDIGALQGPNRPAFAIRRWLAPCFRHHPIVVWLTALAVFLILLAWGPTAGDRRLLGVAILAATTAIAIEALRRQTLREFPDDPHRQSGRPPVRASPAASLRRSSREDDGRQSRVHQDGSWTGLQVRGAP